MFLEFVFVRRLCKSSVTKGGKMVVKTYSLFVIFVHSIDTTPKLLVSWPQARNSSEYQMPFSLENSEIFDITRAKIIDDVLHRQTFDDWFCLCLDNDN